MILIETILNVDLCINITINLSFSHWPLIKLICQNQDIYLQVRHGIKEQTLEPQNVVKFCSCGTYNSKWPVSQSAVVVKLSGRAQNSTGADDPSL